MDSLLLSGDETREFRRRVTTGLHKRKILRVVRFGKIAVASTTAGYEKGRTPSSLTIFLAYQGESGTCWLAHDAIFLDAGICPDPTDVGVSIAKHNGNDVLRFVMRAKRDDNWIAYGIVMGEPCRAAYMRSLPEEAVAELDAGKVENFHWLLRQRQLPSFIANLLSKIRTVTQTSFVPTQ